LAVAFMYCNIDLFSKVQLVAYVMYINVTSASALLDTLARSEKWC